LLGRRDHKTVAGLTLSLARRVFSHPKRWRMPSRMNMPSDLIDQCEQFSTVMVVGRLKDLPDRIVELLADAGLNVLGPVDSAARALAIVAQTAADIALIHPELSGQRDGFELARDLEHTWGVPSVIIPAG
jgi:hypothetical protein